MSVTVPRQPRVPRTNPMCLWRIARGWTQREMAEELGVSVPTLQRLEAKPALPKKYQLAFDRIRTQYKK